HWVAESLKLFLSEGIRGVTIGTLSRHLGVSSKTLYQYFGDKHGLAKACLSLHQEKVGKVYQRLAEEGQDAAEVFTRYYHTQIERLIRTHPSFFRDVRHYFPDSNQQKIFFCEPQTRELLQRGQTEGLFQPGVNHDLAAATLTLLMQSIFEGQTFGAYGTRELMTQVLWPYLRGLCTQAGMAVFRRHRLED
ncbi:MAG: TetR/AcrR family transcriptional regulator, partial [Bacteroidota bacterium]